MSGNREQADDLFQETFKRVHEKAHTFRGSRFKPWLFTIATRVAVDGLRKRGRLRVLSMSEKSDCGENSGGGLDVVAVADNAFNPLEEAEKAERAEQVRQTIELLPAKQRATLVLAYYQQLSYREVADVLGCSIGTVKVQMYRALRTLARKLPDVSEKTG
jgi:RNA polymerase sigma-70 factor (ECF subfamily)